MDIPHGSEIYTEGDNTYIRCQGRKIVSDSNGQRKFFRGTDEQARKRAARWLWRFYEGYETNYRYAHNDE